jgi:pilus assembly protein CpaE
MMNRATDEPASGGLSRKTGPDVRVFVTEQESEKTIRQSLADLGVSDVQYSPGNVETAIATLAKQPSPRLLIIDISGIADPVSTIHSLAEVCEPTVGVIAIGNFNDIVLYRSLKETGIVDYFFKPLMRDMVMNACDRILTKRTDQPKPANLGKLVLVMGVRGGVGATTVVTNTAWAVSELKQRWTMVLDLDIEGGDTALQLDSSPGLALREAFQHPERVDRLFIDRGAVHVTKRLDLLASLEPLADAVWANEAAVLSLLEMLMRRYRLVFVDLPTRVAMEAPQVLHLPCTCLLVSNASLASARDVARWREHIGPNTLDRRTLHLLNHTTPQGGLPESEFIRASGQAPDLSIPYDKALAEASSFGIGAMQKCSLFKRSIMAMIHELTGEPIEMQGSFLKRIFG